MTAQVPDSVELDGQMYSVVGVLGGPLFAPAVHHLQPAMISTACWRGYICWYGVIDGSLRLVRLVVGSRSRVAGQTVSSSTTLLGRTFTPSSAWTGPGWEIAGMAVPVPITGGMLLGHGFISSTYVHMGFHPAWKFETVIEVLLEDGVVTGTLDRSDEISVIRERIETGAIANPDGPPGGDNWVRRTFTLDYSRSLPGATY